PAQSGPSPIISLMYFRWVSEITSRVRVGCPLAPGGLTANAAKTFPRLGFAGSTLDTKNRLLRPRSGSAVGCGSKPEGQDAWVAFMVIASGVPPTDGIAM